MSNMKNHLEDIHLAHTALNDSRRSLEVFLQANPYQRGGTYPKRLSLHRSALACSIIRLHQLLAICGVLRNSPKEIRISRKRTAYLALNGFAGIATS
jgi:hypothetical protein